LFRTNVRAAFTTAIARPTMHPPGAATARVDVHIIAAGRPGANPHAALATSSAIS